jgi:hypothetical protein
MKKIFVILLITCSTLMFSQTVTTSSDSVASKNTLHAKVIPADKLSNTTYQLVPILKIYATKDSYLILYHGGEWNIEKVAFPKEWFKQGDSRGTIRNTPPKMDAFLTIFYTNGKFSNATISAPSDEHNTVWGVLQNKDISQFLADDSFILQY